MNDPRWPNALLSGLVGATALTLIHESVRRLRSDAPRMDTLGRRAIARGLEVAGIEPPGRDALQATALVGDLATNTFYFALVGLGKPSGSLVRGAVLGAAAGLGAAALPPFLGLGRKPGARTPQTAMMTFGWYLVGGLAAGATHLGLSSRRT